MQVMLYALSTCGWCKKTRQLFDEHGVKYDYVYVDQQTGEEKERTLAEVRRWNPNTSFPTVVIDDNLVIVGFQEARLREALKL